MLELDRRVWLPDDLLVKADKITMATSVELRVPFLDHRLIEWSAGLPASVKLRNGTGKWILREAARHRLPAECTAGGKRGFTVPVANWMRKQLYEPLREELLASDSLPRTRFGEKAVRELLEEHKSGKADRKEELYALWVLEKWRKRFDVGPPVASAGLATSISTTTNTNTAKRKAGAGMGALKGRDIVCFSNDWDGDPLSKMHAMKILARENRVLWVNSIGNRRPTASTRDAKRVFKKIAGAIEGMKERHPNIWVLTPLAIPFYGNEWVRAANGALLKAPGPARDGEAELQGRHQLELPAFVRAGLRHAGRVAGGLPLRGRVQRLQRRPRERDPRARAAPDAQGRRRHLLLGEAARGQGAGEPERAPRAARRGPGALRQGLRAHDDHPGRIEGRARPDHRLLGLDR